MTSSFLPLRWGQFTRTIENQVLWRELHSVSQRGVVTSVDIRHSELLNTKIVCPIVLELEEGANVEKQSKWTDRVRALCLMGLDSSSIGDSMFFQIILFVWDFVLDLAAVMRLGEG